MEEEAVFAFCTRTCIHSLNFAASKAATATLFATDPMSC